MVTKTGASIWLALETMVERAKELGTDEQGEMASWLIMAAGLAAAAAAAIALLGPWIATKVGQITAN